MTGSQFIASSDQVFQSAVGVVGGLHPSTAKRRAAASATACCSGDGVGQAAREVVGRRERKQRLRETFLEFSGFPNGLTCCNETEALDHGMLGHMTVPFHDIHDVAAFVSDGRSRQSYHNHMASP